MGVIYNQTDPNVVTVYVYPQGTTVYVYGWAYSAEQDEDGVVTVFNGRVFAYQVQFSNSMSASGFSSKLMDSIYQRQDDLASGKVTYEDINEDYLVPPGKIEEVAQEYGGTISDYLNYKLAENQIYNGFQDFANAIGLTLRDFNEEWGFQIFLHFYSPTMITR
jgi:hypothetical protein